MEYLQEKTQIKQNLFVRKIKSLTFEPPCFLPALVKVCPLFFMVQKFPGFPKGWNVNINENKFL